MKQTLRHVAFITVMSLFGLTGQPKQSVYLPLETWMGRESPMLWTFNANYCPFSGPSEVSPGIPQDALPAPSPRLTSTATVIPRSWMAC